MCSTDTLFLSSSLTWLSVDVINTSKDNKRTVNSSKPSLSYPPWQPLRFNTHLPPTNPSILPVVVLASWLPDASRDPSLKSWLLCTGSSYAAQINSALGR